MGGIRKFNDKSYLFLVFLDIQYNRSNGITDRPKAGKGIVNEKGEKR